MRTLIEVLLIAGMLGLELVGIAAIVMFVVTIAVALT